MWYRCGRIRTHSGSFGDCCATVNTTHLYLTESARLELARRVTPTEGLAIPCRSHWANSPKSGDSEIRTHNVSLAVTVSKTALSHQIAAYPQKKESKNG